ncbi:restriction endonuclease [Lactobacillus curvatus]|nr:restriction endonuclease [Latilactobacillus curvatus]MSE23980.1 restriction endonuclease [Latilactobacillus curvatus]
MNFETYLGLSNKEKFNYFMETRFPTNRTPAYWVNWNNVLNNSREYEISLNTLEYLVGKDNIQEEARLLFTEQPNLLKVVPILLATRDLDINVLAFDEVTKQMYTYNVDFSKPDVNDMDDYLDFMTETGLFNFLSNYVNKSLVDYVYGVQVGLDSNGRKNRGGAENENILENNLKLLTKNNSNLRYKVQATGKWIKKNWDITVPEVLEKNAKGGRRYDGAVLNIEQNSVTIIETNFYNGGGSKLKAVAGEFSSIYQTSLKGAQNIKFVWISDGPGWDTAQNPMREAFDVIPTIINLEMVKEGMLAEIIDYDSKII